MTSLINEFSQIFLTNTGLTIIEFTCCVWLLEHVVKLLYLIYKKIKGVKK